eukprot:TRINITY_DN1993_c0_g2_i1.p1 TRINITY_DN1993_c0_g2~~TRINITY_DN1993_c0_g2_i1.p1  ORF type:complete len:1034 (-),score=286.32 TRINITY_DN1993_c0_g2_i1:174-3275(-)
MSRILRSDSSLFEVLLQEYHSDSGGSYRDVRIRFEDGSCLETSRLLLGSLSEILFESLSSIPSWEDAEILVPGLDPGRTRGLLESLLCVPGRSEWAKEDLSASQDVISALGLDAPPALEKRLRAYHCEDCDVHLPKEAILAHVRDFHPRSRKVVSSPIWSFFDPTEHPEFHRCRECKAVIKDKANSALIRHLEIQHPDSYEEILIQGVVPESTTLPYEDRLDKRRSVIWKYFSVSNGTDSALCKACSRSFRVRGQTSSMIRHLKLAHPELYGDYAQSTLMTGRVELSGEEEASSLSLNLGAGVSGGEELVAVSTSMPEAGEEAALIQEEEEEESPLIRSPLRSYFERQSGGQSYEYDCKSCSTSFNLDIQSTADMMKHLKNKHPLLHRELLDGFDDEDAIDEEEVALIDDEDSNDREWRLEEDSSEEESPAGKKNMVWKYFEATGAKNETACSLCSRLFKCKNGNTSVLERHLRRSHPVVLLEEEEKKRKPMALELSAEDISEEDIGKDIGYFADFFSPTEDDGALHECKLCNKVFREENVLGQVNHIKEEHPNVVEDVSTRKVRQPSTGSLSTGGDGNCPKVKKRSLIWNYFNQTDTPGMNSCNYCRKIFKCKGQTTSSMIRHLKSEHNGVYEEFTSLTASIYGRKIGEPFQRFTPLDHEEEGGDEQDVKMDSEFPTSLDDSELESPSSLKKLFKRRSSIWNYFDPTSIPDTNACKMCKKEFKCKGRTTSSMIRHLKKVHMDSFKEFLRFRSVSQDIYARMGGKSLKTGGKNNELILQYFLQSPKNPEWRECRDCKECITKAQGKKGQALLVRHLEDEHPIIYEAYLNQGGLPSASPPATEESSKVCSECGEKFANRSSLTQHMKTVHAASCPFKCLECGACFTRRESYEQHSHDKNKPRNFLCTICGKTFARRSIRNFHEKAHKGDKKYECSYCPKKFLTNQRKYKHERTHTGEKPYQCTECGRQFTQSHHLVTHARIHTGQKPYTCNFCPQTFRHLSSRNNHKCEGKLRNSGLVPPGPTTTVVLPSSSHP